VEDFLAETYIRFNLESIRAVQAGRLGALLHAAWLGKENADFSDLAAVLPAALRHRLEQPKLLEIIQVMKNTVESEKKREESRRPAREGKPAGESKMPGYPAIWRGIWQRVSHRKNSTGSAAPTLQNPQCHNKNLSDEKKKEAVPTVREETGSSE
jgi:hypothetical protein